MVEAHLVLNAVVVRADTRDVGRGLDASVDRWPVVVVHATVVGVRHLRHGLVGGSIRRA